MLAAAITLCGASCVCAQNPAKAAASRAAGVPRLQPMPSTATRGMICSAVSFSAGVSVRAKSAAAASAAGSTPAGGVPCMGQWLAKCTVRPASSAPLTALMRPGSATVQCWCLAHSSTANTPFASVAVVMTGTAPHTFASRRARALAPPRWPDSSGTAKRPHSSSTTTAGSAALLRQCGAMARTAMPTAPTKTRASASANWAAVQSASVVPFSPQRATVPGQAAASLCASASPLAVKARYAQVITALLCGTQW